MHKTFVALSLFLCCVPQPTVGYASALAQNPVAANSAAATSGQTNSAASARPAKATPNRQESKPRRIDFGSTAALAALLAAFVLTYLCCHPVIAFARRGWFIKKADIFSSLNTEAKAYYLRTFNIEGASKPDAAFENMYQLRYGRYRLIIPVALLVLVAFPLLYLLVSSGLGGLLVQHAEGSKALSSLATSGKPVLALPVIAQAAVAGAFVWIVANLSDGAARYNMPPQTVLGAALRLAVAVPVGYAVQSVAAGAIAPFIAFAIGAFPLGEVQILLKRLTTDKLKLEEIADRQHDKVRDLDGIDQPTADRLADGDIMTIPQLAYCDPVQLSMRTNLSFTSIIDAQGQALARIYIGDSLPQLFKIGLRGAIEIRNFTKQLEKEDSADGPMHKLLKVASDRTAISPDLSPRPAVDPLGLRNAFEEIAGDPYTEFLTAVWATSCVDCSNEEPPSEGSAKSSKQTAKKRAAKPKATQAASTANGSAS